MLIIYLFIIFIESLVVVSFVIDKEGNVGNVKVIRPVSPDIDREAVRVIKLMSGWEPGVLNGQKVDVVYNMPIVFRVS